MQYLDEGASGHGLEGPEVDRKQLVDLALRIPVDDLARTVGQASNQSKSVQPTGVDRGKC